MSEWDEIGATVARTRVLDRAEMPVDTAQLARFLIGKMLMRVLAEGVAGGRIVETEAYGIGDPAGHAYRGITPRNRALFLERGHAYVYLAYGISFMLNNSSALREDRRAKFAPEELRRRQLAAMTAWVLAGARSQPAIIAFEDLHWADPTSLDLMARLAERGAQSPLLVVATTRPEFPP